MANRKLIIIMEYYNITSCLLLQQSGQHYLTLEMDNYNLTHVSAFEHLTF